MTEQGYISKNEQGLHPEMSERRKKKETGWMVMKDERREVSVRMGAR